MKHVFFLLALVSLLTFFTCNALADVMSFDDISYSSELQGYHGFNFIDTSLVDTSSYNYGNYPNSAVSDYNVIYNSWNNPMIIYDNCGFDFIGAYFTSAWLTNEEIKIEGYSDIDFIHLNNPVFSQSYYIYDTPTYLNVNLTDIKLLKISSNCVNVNNGHFIIDDFEYSKNCQPVPEPATILLFGIGCISVGLIGKLFKK